MAARHSLQPILALAMLLPLGGCVGGAVEAADAAKDIATCQDNLEQATAGDPKAEFAVGDAWCCSLSGRTGLLRHPVYSDQTATDWLCRSARQHYGPAQLELAASIPADRSATIC